MIRVETLAADADSIHPAGGEDFDQLVGDRFWVCFDGELAAVRQGQMQPESLQQSRPEMRCQQGGRSPSDENRLQGRRDPCRSRLNLLNQPTSKRFLPILAVHDAEEIAVVALMEAEWDVDVNILENIALNKN